VGVGKVFGFWVFIDWLFDIFSCHAIQVFIV
jgi:hypothetical protein